MGRIRFTLVVRLARASTPYIPRTRKGWIRAAVVFAVILSPIGIAWLYQAITAFPKEITIATGQKGGLYLPLCEDLAARIEERLEVKVRIVKTKGSLENLLSLRGGQVDFALYQPSTLEVLSRHLPKTVEEQKARLLPGSPEAEKDVAFVANLYSQPAHLIVRRDAGITKPADLAGKKVHFGLDAMSILFRQRFGLAEEPVVHKVGDLELDRIVAELHEGNLDAAFTTVGVRAEIFKTLAEEGKCDLLSIPQAEALSENHVSMSEYRIPQGFYGSQPSVIPSDDVQTVAFGAQLLTRSDVHTALVEEVTRIALSEDFLKRNQLGELFAGGPEFARKRPEFAIHPGARNFYEPELRPVLDPDFVGSLEGVRSLAVSVVIAVLFGVRWLGKRRLKRKEHKLDRFIRSLLDIERRQLTLDTSGRANDVENLQKLLDEVTLLEQEALGEFSAHELNEERAAECFIDMCHDLSSKMNAKISRQRLDMRFAELAAAISGRTRPTPD